MTQPPDDAALVARAALLPCPFCGADCGFVLGPDTAPEEEGAIECPQCGVEMLGDNMRAAITAWNTRAALEPSDKGVGR